MENRFGLKDAILFLLVSALILLVILAMVQYDHQWTLIQRVQGQLDEQSQELRNINTMLSNGVALRGNGGSPTTQSGVAVAPAMDGDPFARLRAAPTQPAYSQGVWVIGMFAGQVAKLTPMLSGDVYARDVQDYVLESLAQRDPNTLAWSPFIATEWRVKDDSAAYDAYVARQKTAGKTDEEIAKDPKLPEAVTIDFKMRDNVRFSDGEPLTADDVVFTYDFIMNPAIAAPRDRAYLERIKRVVKKGPYEVEFVFQQPYFEAFSLAGGLGILPKHFYEKFKAEDFNQSTGYLMGSGPYRLEDPTAWKPGMPIQLVRNDRYWGLAPAFDRLVFQEISSDKARLATFRNGKADIFGATPDQYRQLIDDPSLMSHVQRFEYQSPVSGYRFIAWNEKNPLFADKRVRQALTMLLDRDRMIQQIYYGYAVLATGPFSPLSKQYNHELKPWTYNVNAAEKLLTDAGFKVGSDHLLHAPDGKPFRFNFTYPAGTSNYDQMALFMKDSYAHAGIVVNPDPLEWGAFTQRLQDKNFEAISLGWSAGVETDIYQMFHSSQAGPGGDDFMSYKSPELDKLIDEARRTMDDSKRMKLWQQAHAVLHEDQPYTFLWFGKSLVFVDNRIKNIQRVTLGLNPRTEWYVPASMQKWTK
jgi:peptide/nickel transport system substrate-binding protein